RPSFALYKPSLLLPRFSEYASKVFQVWASEYIELIAPPEEILKLLEEEAFQTVIARMVPNSELCTPQPEEPIIGFDESIGSFYYNPGFRQRGVSRGNYQPSGDWEHCIGHSWVRFCNSSQSILPDMRFWHVHPFQFALRSPSNRSRLSTQIEAGLKNLRHEWAVEMGD